MMRFRVVGTAVVAALGITALFAQQSGVAPKTLGGPQSPPTILLNRLAPPPAWAFAERAMLDSAAAGVQLWVDRYVNADGTLNGVEHWGVSDGPDDIMEDIRGWPLVYALGAPESVIRNFEKVWRATSASSAARRFLKWKWRRMESTSRNFRRHSTGSTTAKGFRRSIGIA